MSIYSQVATGALAVNTTITPTAAFALDAVSIHLSAAGGAGNLTITLDAIAGAAYDVNLLTQDMTSVTDLYWQPERPVECLSGDKIVIAWANGSGRTYGLNARWLGR